MLEDALLHPAAPFLTWMMLACGDTAADSKFSPPESLVNICLRITFELAAVRVQVCEF